MRASITTACIAVALLCAGAVGRAQRAPAPVLRPGWLPLQRNYDKTITGAQRAILEPRLEQIERLLLRTPEISHPVGFEVQPTFEAFTGPNGELISSAYRLAFFVPSKAENEGCTCLEVFVNPPPERIHPWDQRPTKKDDRGDAVYLEELIGEPRPGATLVYGKLLPTDRSFYVVLLTAGGASPLLQVTREQYLKTLILDLGGAQKSPYQQWLDDAPGRKQAREATASLLPANERAAFLRQQEDSEREVTAQFKAAAGGPQAADPVRSRLASLTPAERDAPVWVAEPWGYGQFLAPKSPNAFHAVRRNPAFYVPMRSPTEARGIEVRFSTSEAPLVQRAVSEAARIVDWSALAALLDSPAR
jgi:hypothetical protein